MVEQPFGSLKNYHLAWFYRKRVHSCTPLDGKGLIFVGGLC